MPIRAEVDKEEDEKALKEIEKLSEIDAEIEKHLEDIGEEICYTPQNPVEVKKAKSAKRPIEPTCPKKHRSTSKKSYAILVEGFKKRHAKWEIAVAKFDKEQSYEHKKEANRKKRDHNDRLRELVKLNEEVTGDTIIRTYEKAIAKGKDGDKQTYYVRKQLGEITPCPGKSKGINKHIKKKLTKKEEKLREQLRLDEAIRNKEKKVEEVKDGKKMEVTPVYELLYQSTQDIKVLQGSSRSSKTYSIVQYLVIKAIEEAQDDKLKHEQLDVLMLRSYLSTAKETVFLDFKAILMSLGLWNDRNFHKTAYQYKLYNTTFKFGGTEGDGGSKFMGKDSWRIFLNEISEISKSSYDQITMRCKNEILVDFNPKMSESHYVFTSILAPNNNVKVGEEDKVYFHISNFQMNRFCPAKVRKRLESYEPTEINIANGTADEYLWSVYGEGHLAKLDGFIYTRTGYFESLELEEIEKGKIAYGLDFGFSHEAGFCRVGVKGNKLYTEELYYDKETTVLKNVHDDKQKNFETIFEELGVDKITPIICDSSRPEQIRELQSLGYNVKGVKKPKVFDSVMKLRQFQWYTRIIDENMNRELETYRWNTDKNGNIIKGNEIRKAEREDELMDAVRYAMTELYDFGKSRLYGDLDPSKQMATRKRVSGVINRF